VCPENAITMTREYQLATDDNKDLYIRNEITMGPCGRCGRCFKPKSALDKMMVTGFQHKGPIQKRLGTASKQGE
jgi:ferredoxin